MYCSALRGPSMAAICERGMLTTSNGCQHGSSVVKQGGCRAGAHAVSMRFAVLKVSVQPERKQLAPAAPRVMVLSVSFVPSPRLLRSSRRRRPRPRASGRTMPRERTRAVPARTVPLSGPVRARKRAPSHNRPLLWAHHTSIGDSVSVLGVRQKRPMTSRMQDSFAGN